MTPVLVVGVGVVVVLVAQLAAVGARSARRQIVDGPSTLAITRVARSGRQAAAAGLASGWSAVRCRPVTGALLVGGVLRLLWVIWATRTPPPITDPSEYLRIAVDLTHGVSPRFGGVGGPSAYWPPGYPAILTPFVGFADRTGWLSVAFAASLVNVVAGTLSVALAGRLACQWLGSQAEAPAAWLVAMCPALVYFTSTAHSDTVFIALFLGVLVLVGRPTAATSWRRWALVGLLLGATCLVRAPALAALVVPALALRSATGTWRSSVRASLVVAAGAAVLLVPWMIRNGVQVGVWTPGSTNNAAAVCFGHDDRARPEWSDSLADPLLQAQCFGGSPYTDPALLPVYQANGDRWATARGSETFLAHPRIDEATWYSERISQAVRWAVAHPAQEVSLSAGKAWVVWRSEGTSVDSGRNYSEPGWAGAWQTPLGVIANLWLWGTVGLAVWSLVRSPLCRRATPVWVPVVTLTLGIVVAVGEAHYRLPANPLVAVLAAGALCTGRRGSKVADDVA